MIQPVPKSKWVRVMVWVDFEEDSRSDPYQLDRDFESKKISYSVNLYLEILEDNMLGIRQPSPIFMQDNASIHKTEKVIK